MANITKCPVCGESNLPDQEFCQYCQARLKPLTGNLKGVNETLTPGQIPTKKNTAELEPILPQWLREARSTARQTSEEEAAQTAQQPQTPLPASPGADLLAGLHAQRQAQDNDEEDTPDWLTNITGEAPKAKKSQPESSEVRWVELGVSNDFAQSEPAADDTPAWLAGINAAPPQPGEKDELTDWFRDASDSQKPQQPPQPLSFDNPPSALPTETPDWLHSMVTDDGAFNDSGNTFDETPISSDTPDWLRAMSAENDAQNNSKPSSNLGASSTSSDTPDWLRAIAAKNDAPSAPPVSSDTPDWLHSMATENDAQNASTSADSDTPGWLNSMATENNAQNASASADADTPDWLSSMATENNAQNASASVDADTPDWLSSMATENDAQNASASTDADTPDWLSSMATENDAQNASASANADTPDWLRSMVAENDVPSTPSTSSSDDVPDWLGTMAVENDVPSKPSASSDTPDWLSSMGVQEKTQGADSVGFSETRLGESDAAFSSAEDTPDWLRDSKSDASSSDQDWLKGLGESEPSAQDSAPAWLSAAPTSTPEPQQTPAVPEKEDDSLDLPSWLKAAAPQSSIYDEPAVVKQESPAPSSSDSSDWLNAFKSVDTPEASAFSADAPVNSEPPVFADNVQSKANADTLFTEMPDWLSVVDASASPESIPAPITNVDAIAPGDLPSWVQAMRPVDAGVPPQPSSTSLSGAKALESRGALAGLQGVLPAVAGFSPTSKPKAYSIRMQASEEQLAHAALLEQILDAETAPVSIGSFSTLGSSRSLRWLLTLLFFAALTVVLFIQIPIFSAPMGLPSEVEAAANVAQSMPEDAPVLVVFDYEPARVGEMEAATAPILDRMNNPRLTFISTNESGAILAEHFISGYLANNKESRIIYLNLGYLPGGPMGIRAFVQNPQVTAPYALAQSPALFNFALTPAWDSAALQAVDSFSKFAALVVITDNSDSARAWIEQTTAALDPTIPAIPIVVISSAQAAPMIQPYYASQQINGLVSGLYDNGLVGQSNNATAYSIGMLLAVILIVGGGLLNLVLGLRERAETRETK